MKISVIIAVYNGEQFIEKALRSCHHFDCVKEIILIDDGSKDDSLKIAQSFVDQFPKLKVIQHENAVNKGAGASWSLGIKKASFEWIAILGVDDVFLKNRFDFELKLYKENKEIAGVYGAMGVHYYSENAEKKFQNLFKTDLTTVRKPIEPENLKYLLLQMYKGNHGYFSLNSLTVKKSLLLEVGLFNEKLRLHQDTDMIVKLSCKGKLVYGSIDKPVSSRGVHEDNRITSGASNFGSRYLMYKELYEWMQKNSKDQKILQKLGLDLKCYAFLSKNESYSVFEAFFYAVNTKLVFYNNKYFNLIIRNSNTSESIKSYIIRLKEKIVLLFLKERKKAHSIYINE